MQRANELKAIDGNSSREIGSRRKAGNSFAYLRSAPSRSLFSCIFLNFASAIKLSQARFIVNTHSSLKFNAPHGGLRWISATKTESPFFLGKIGKHRASAGTKEEPMRADNVRYR